MNIYKIVTIEQWRVAEATGLFKGASIDLADGFIHFSTADQLAETLEKHFAGQRDLLLVAVDADQFGDELRWEVSRGGKLFPHLYATLAVVAANRVTAISVDGEGRHVLDV